MGMHYQLLDILEQILINYLNSFSNGNIGGNLNGNALFFQTELS